MFAITVTEKGGEQRHFDFDKPEVTIGRVQGNDIVLPKGNVSKRHARIVLKDGKFIVVDLKSTNGTYVNGRKITSPLVVKGSDKIYIGDFILGIDESAVVSDEPEELTSEPRVPMSPPEHLAARAAPIAPAPLEPPPEPVIAPAPPEPMIAPAPSVVAPPPSVVAPPPSVVAPAPPPMVAAPARPMPPNATIQSAAPVRMPVRAAIPGATPAVAVVPPVGAGNGAEKKLVGAGVNRIRSAAAIVPRAEEFAPLGPKVVKRLEMQERILEHVVAALRIDSVPIENLGDEELWQKAESAIVEKVESMEASGELPNFLDQDELIKETLNEALGLGPLEDLLANPDNDEIVVDRRDSILVGKQGTLTSVDSGFSSDETLRRVVDRLVVPAGATIGEKRPLVEVRLRDGSWLSAAVPPISVHGACLTLRRTRAAGATLGDLVARGVLSEAMASFLGTCVSVRRNILVCGAPSSGKLEVLAALASDVPPGERLITIEAVSELALVRDRWISLQSRGGDSAGVPEFDVASLVRSAMRMRPDRLLVSELRGSEAYDLLQLMMSSCDGVLASIGGADAKAALARLALAAQMASPGAALEAVRASVATAIDVVVHVARQVGGAVRVTAVEEVVAGDGHGFTTQGLFVRRGDLFSSLGAVPHFYAELESRGIVADKSIFST